MVHHILRLATGLLGFMYAWSAAQFILQQQIAFISYNPVTAPEIWTVRNLGARLLGIAVGMILVSVMNSVRGIALMLTVRLVSDAGDWINSLLTPGLDPFVSRMLAVFVVIELALLTLALREMRQAVTQ